MPNSTRPRQLARLSASVKVNHYPDISLIGGRFRAQLGVATTVANAIPQFARGALLSVPEGSELTYARQ